MDLKGIGRPARACIGPERARDGQGREGHQNNIGKAGIGTKELGPIKAGFGVEMDGKRHRINVLPLCPEPGALPG
jgi:hypothetical protein